MVSHVSLLSNNDKYVKIRKTISEVKQEEPNHIREIAEFSVLGLSSAAALYYFMKYHNLKNIPRTTGNITASIKPPSVPSPLFGESNYTSTVSAFTEGNSTQSHKPRWNTVMSGTTALRKKDANRKHSKNKIPLAGQSLQDIIPSSKIREITTEIKLYMQRSGIDSKNKKVNPEALDEILTRIIGKENVKERPFKPAECMSKGRVKEYTAPNGRIYILETHLHNEEGYVTRLYLTHRDRDLRAYLHPDGSFRLNSYGMGNSHFETTAKGKRWMECSEFLTGKPAK